MGYTHYLHRAGELPKRQWGAFKQDVLRIFKASEVPVVGGFGEPDTQPEVTDDIVIFNGAGEDGYETCVVERIAEEALCTRCKKTAHEHQCRKCLFDSSTFKASPKHLFTFTKTGRAKYDPAVCAVYLAAAHHFGTKVQVKSDGDWGEWKTGADLYTKATGREAVAPWDVFTCTRCGGMTDDGHIHYRKDDEIACYSCMTPAEHAARRAADRIRRAA
jgi:hypothetical protein